MPESIELSHREMQIIMLCLRGEYETVNDFADTLHDKLASEGFTGLEEQQPARNIAISYREI